MHAGMDGKLKPGLGGKETKGSNEPAKPRTSVEPISPTVGRRHEARVRTHDVRCSARYRSRQQRGARLARISNHFALPLASRAVSEAGQWVCCSGLGATAQHSGQNLLTFQVIYQPGSAHCGVPFGCYRSLADTTSLTGEVVCAHMSSIMALRHRCSGMFLCLFSVSFPRFYCMISAPVCPIFVLSGLFFRYYVSILQALIGP
jgi:hypothetical protein